MVGVADITPDSTPEETARVDLQIILQTLLEPKGANLIVPITKIGVPTHLRTYIKAATSTNWNDILQSFKKTTEELRGARLLPLMSRGNIFLSLRVANQGILWRDLSIDLVAAALRQREFTNKITSPDSAGIDHPLSLSKACSRYHKFILLMNRKMKARKFGLVPTLDIDLCWHTHQLAGYGYREWCIKHLGVAVNHDDTVTKEAIADGLKETTKAWWDAYREPYTNVDERPRSHSISSLFNRKGKGMSSLKLKLTAETKMKDDNPDPYLSMYPYWIMYPSGWDYPAACASGKPGRGGWAASVDQQDGSISHQL